MSPTPCASIIQPFVVMLHQNIIDGRTDRQKEGREGKEERTEGEREGEEREETNHSTLQTALTSDPETVETQPSSLFPSVLYQ